MPQETDDGGVLSPQEGTELLAEITGTPAEELRDGADAIDVAPPDDLEWSDDE